MRAKAKTKYNFLQGAVILTVSTVLVKLIGMLYKIPLANMLGGTGMSYFMTAYSIFSPIYALSAAGFPAAVSKLVSENAAVGRYRDVRKIFHIAWGLFLLIGLCGFLLLLFSGGAIAHRIGNPHAALAVTALAPALLFCCLMSVWRGYYQGLGNMMPTAVSQVVEAVAKLVCGIGLGYLALQTGLRQYEQTGMVFGAAVSGGVAQAELAVLPYAAAGAVLGVSVSTALGTLFLFFRGLLGSSGIPKETALASSAAEPSKSILKKLALIALPVCLASAVGHLTGLIDVATVMTRIGVAVQRDAQTVLGMYSLPAHVTAQELPSYLYGAFGYTSSLYNLVPALTVALGISGLPALSVHWALRDMARVNAQASSLVKIAALIAIPVGLGLAALPEPILLLLYPNRLQEAVIAAPILRAMGIAAVFSGIAVPLNSVFQAIGRADIPVKLMCAGGIFKITANYILLAVPSVNIKGVPYGTIACYAFIVAGGIWCLRTVANIRIDIAGSFVKPLACGIFCMLAANTSYALLMRAFPSRWNTLLAIAVGGVIYAVFVLFLKIITKNEALMLPNGKKIVKILEKLSCLG